ncbi:MAG: outer membrane lipoprotein-sorting protein [Nitrospirae bacterium]|nr:outer membrane lipoprotein-sorting protein [Nitrospirota bacterium]
MKTAGRFAVIGLMISLGTVAQAPVGIAADGTEIVRKSQAAFYEAGDDLKARVKMTLTTREGGMRLREMTLLRRNDPAGRQKYFIYFHNPADVAGTTFMVHKYPGRDDDRWLFIPAINLVNRIAARDSRSSFVGSDFTYEDVSGRDLEGDTHRLLREEDLKGRKAYVVESVPKSAAEYTRKLAWIDPTTFLPIKEEYYDVQGALYKTFTSDEVKEVQGFPTVTKRTMSNVKTGHKTETVFERIQYNVGLGGDLFSERYLRQPPKRWIE